MIINQTKTISKETITLVTVIVLGGLLRFYKLNWGEGYFFHPDEYHVVISVNQLSFPSQMNPNFFSYGSFIIYLNYFTKLLLGAVSPFLIGRFWSAVFSTLTIYLVFFVSNFLFKNKAFPLLAAGLVGITPGLIQQAHFATPESTLVFFILLTLYFWLRWIARSDNHSLLLGGISLGLALASKIVALVLIPIFFALFLTKNLPAKDSRIQTSQILKDLKWFIFSLTLSFGIFFLISPYALTDSKDFIHSIKYEVGVGRGTPVVFYTRQFLKTSPVVFQITKILPFALGPAVLYYGLAGFLFVFWHTISKMKSKEKTNLAPGVFLLTFIFLFLANSFLFTKWTRFTAPVFPLLVILSVYPLFFLSQTKRRKAFRALLVILILPSLIWSLMFLSIYTRTDVRITATEWVNKNIPQNSTLLTESGNTLEIPLRGNYKKLPFNFYRLDEDPRLRKDLAGLLVDSDYFIIQSRRVFTNHQRLPSQFPVTANFYQQLFSGNLGFIKIHEFDSYPGLNFGTWSLTFPDEFAEETWSVFDHPVIRIYKKTTPLSPKMYEQLLNINQQNVVVF